MIKNEISVETDFSNSTEHARFLETVSFEWLKYHFAFFPIVLLVVSFLLRTEYKTISTFYVSKDLAIVLFIILLLVGLCNLYNQITTRIGYVYHSRNYVLLYKYVNHVNYISTLSTDQTFFKNNTTKFFYFWDFWTARISLVVVTNALAVFALFSIFRLIALEADKPNGNIIMDLSSSMSTQNAILLSSFFAIFQFLAYYLILMRVDKKTDWNGKIIEQLGENAKRNQG